MRLVCCLLGLLMSHHAALGQSDDAATELPRVFIRESLEAREQLTAIQRLELDARWGEAAEAYDRLVGEFGDQLTRLDAQHYRNVTAYVRERLQAWPAQGRQRYAEVCGRRAADAVSRLSATAPAALWVALAERYWLTDAGQDAARHAIERLRAEGYSDAARRWAEQLKAGVNRGPEPKDARSAWPMAKTKPSDAAAGQADGSAEIIWEIPLPPNPGELTLSGAGGAPPDPAAAQTPATAGYRSMAVVGDLVCLLEGNSLWALRLYSGWTEWCVSPQPPESLDEPATWPANRGGLASSSPRDRVIAVITPCDGASVGPSTLLDVNLATGQVLWRAEASPRASNGRLRPVEFFDGAPLVYDGHVYAAIRRRRELSFEDCRLACFQLETGECLWESWVASGPTPPEPPGPAATRPLQGRDGDVLLCPHDGAVACVDGVTGCVRWIQLDPGRETPASASQPASSPSPMPAPAPTLALATHLRLVPLPTGLRCTAPTGEATRLLAARAESLPADAAKWLDWAQFALLRSADFDRGLAALDRAIALCSDSASTTVAHATGQPRERALAITITAAGRWEHEPGPDRLTRIQALRFRAAKLATLPAEQARYRFTFGAAFERLGAVESAIEFYQEVLDQPACRQAHGLASPPDSVPARQTPAEDEPAPLALLTAPMTTAGRCAEQAIDALIQHHGRTGYATFDARAAQACAAASKLRDAAKLRALIEQYPNAACTADALLAWLALPGETHQPLTAARFSEDWLRQHDRGPSELRARISAQIARLYLESGATVEGLSWLHHGQRAYPHAEWQVDGHLESFATLAEHWPAARLDPRGDWPELTLPLQKLREFQRPGASLLTPQETPRYREDRDTTGTILLFDAGQIEAIDPTTGDTQWRVPAVTIGTPAWLGARGDLLLFATPYQLFALDRSGGVLRWNAGEPPLRAASPAVDPEIFTRIVTITLSQTVLVATLSDGHAIAIELASGNRLWQRALPEPPGGALAVDHQYCVYVASTDVPSLVILATADGRLEGEFPLAGVGADTALALTADGTMLIVGVDFVACFDPAAKSLRWRLDHLPPGRPSTVLSDADRLYRGVDGAVECRTLREGVLAWERPLGIQPSGPILSTWLNAGRLYVITEGGVDLLDAHSGAIRDTTAWPPATPVGPAWMTRDGLCISSARPGRASDGSIFWNLSVRSFPHHPEPQALTSAEATVVPEVTLLGPILVTQIASTFAVWGQAATSATQPTPH